MRALLLTSLFIALLSSAACGGSDPPPKSPAQEMVPANSASDPHPVVTDSSASSSAVSTSDSNNDPSGPLLRDPKDPSSPATTTAAPTGSAAGQKAPLANDSASAGAVAHKGGPKATNAECMRSLEKFIAIDPRFAGLPPDAIKQAFTQTAGNPCDGDGITKAQYRCAMKATTSDAWQHCMQ